MAEGGDKWQLGAHSPGTISFTNTQPWGDDSNVGWGQAISSSFGDSWDLKKGITLSARPTRRSITTWRASGSSGP